MIGFNSASVQRSDAVDDQREGRSTSQLGLVEITVPNCFLILSVIGIEVTGQVDLAGGDLLAVYGELGGVEYVQSAGLQSSLNLSNLFSGACSASGTQSGDGNSAGLIALCPVGGDLLTLHSGINGVGVVYRPVVGSGGRKLIQVRSSVEGIAWW